MEDNQPSNHRNFLDELCDLIDLGSIKVGPVFCQNGKISKCQIYLKDNRSLTDILNEYNAKQNTT